MKNIYTAILILLANIFAINAQTTCTPAITNGLVAYYPFCGNANDVSGNSNNGTANGATLASDRFGNANSAYSFNGSSDYISLPSGNSTSLNITGDYTVSFWIKTTDSSGLLTSLGDNVTSPPTAAGYLTGLNGGNVGNGKMGSATRGYWNGSTSNTLADNNWHHVVVVLKADTSRLYIDNVLDNQITGVLTPLSWNGNRVLGCRNDLFMSAGTNYGGILDDISVFNRALSAGEINILYNTLCIPDITTGLVGSYPFSGNANDVSGNGNNGTANGATLTSDRFGNANSAYSFNGSSDYISLPSGNSTSLNITGDYTVSFWIKTTDSSGLLTSLGDNVTSPPTAAGYLTGLNGGNVGNGKMGSATRGYWNGSTSNTLADNNWHHVVALLKADTSRLYIDNVLDNQVTGVLTPLSWNGNRVLGCRNDLFMSAGTNYGGILDDISVYNRALKICDIDSLFNKPNPLTSVSETIQINTFSIYPNPTNGIVFINGIKNETIVVYNSLGTIIKESKAENKIDMSKYSGGLYFIQVIDSDGKIIYTTKILKQQ